MYRKTKIMALILALVLGSLACNLPFVGSQTEATPAPTDAGLAAPTDSGFAAPTGAPADPGQAPEATQPVGQETPIAATEAVSGGGGGTGGEKKLTLATTDALAKSGLLDRLVNAFMESNPYEITLELGGAGRAFRLGEKYVADVLLVNNPGDEIAFVEGGFGRDRVLVFHADSVIVGPADDPAGIKGTTSAVEALKKIAGASAKFVTRGNEGDTVTLEEKLWQDAAITPAGEWYLQAVDSGVVGVLKQANDKKAYTITSRETFLQNQASLPNIAIMVEGDPALFDIYHVVTGNPDKSPKINYAGAQAFVQFLASPQAQEIIAQFGADTYGQPIFFPDAGKPDY